MRISLFFSMMLLASAAEARTLYVSASSSALFPDGSSWGKAYGSLEKGLKKAVAGDTIRLDVGLYFPNGPITTDNLTIQGEGVDATQLTTSYVAETVTRFAVLDVTFVSSEAGLRSPRAITTVTRCAFVNESVGVRLAYGTVQDSFFTGNSVALVLAGGGSVRVQGNHFQSNIIAVSDKHETTMGAHGVVTANLFEGDAISFDLRGGDIYIGNNDLTPTSVGFDLTGGTYRIFNNLLRTSGNGFGLHGSAATIVHNTVHAYIPVACAPNGTVHDTSSIVNNVLWNETRNGHDADAFAAMTGCDAVADHNIGRSFQPGGRNFESARECDGNWRNDGVALGYSWLQTDYYGTTRASPPDMGASEKPCGF